MQAIPKPAAFDSPLILVPGVGWGRKVNRGETGFLQLGHVIDWSGGVMREQDSDLCIGLKFLSEDLQWTKTFTRNFSSQLFCRLASGSW